LHTRRGTRGELQNKGRKEKRDSTALRASARGRASSLRGQGEGYQGGQRQGDDKREGEGYLVR